MFGYVKTDYPNLYVKDTILYRAMYCGLCKSIGEVCGQKARLVLNYDLAFLSVLLHNLKDIDVEITKQHCVIHRIGKHPIAKPDELSKRIAALNVILAYHKLNDDVIDLNKGRLKRNFFKSAYKKCVKKEPKLNEIVSNMYKNLLVYEKKGSDSVDMVSDPFGVMMQDIVKELLGDKFDESVSVLSYNLGKWIYLIDAIDDFEKDKKKKSFNVFINLYNDIDTKKQLMAEKGQEIIPIFADIISQLQSGVNGLKYNFNHDLLDNVLILGIKKQTKNILENITCKNTTKF